MDTLYDQFTPTERLSLLMEAMAREDWAEVKKLRYSCPRAAYKIDDPAFEERRLYIGVLALAISADLRVMLAKLRIFQSVEEMTPYLTSPHAMAAEFCFLAGWRLGQGLEPLQSPPMEVGDEEGDYLDVDAYLAEARAGTGLSVFTEEVDETWEPTPKQLRELDAWDAPKLWVELANKRVAGFHRSIVRRLVGNVLGTWAAWDAFCTTHVGVSGDVVMRAHVPTVVEQVEAMRAKRPAVQPRDDCRAEYEQLLADGWGKRFG
ncbi:MAG TPA: hypothetical protein VGN72_10770 [Tepidisphaeraceae bacterium]|jgi:hypothetical protein|nr:hypothetical protein [Tepidisphaeraceae bacterium]